MKFPLALLTLSLLFTSLSFSAGETKSEAVAEKTRPTLTFYYFDR